MTQKKCLSDVDAYLKQMAAQPRPTMTAEVLAAIRLLPDNMMAGMDLPVGKLARVEDFTLPGPADNIAMRLFDKRKQREAGPVVVYFHGGGFVVGSIDTHAGICASIARQLDLPVLSVDYRLAPENPWPAAPDDAEAASRWIAENHTALGIKANALILAGDSAGGNLTAVTAIALRDRPAALPIRFQLLIYPVTDHTIEYPSHTAFADGYGLSSQDIALYGQHYAGGMESWRYSPLLADLDGVAPALVITAEFDPLRDQGRAYAAKLANAGVCVTYHEVAGTIHGFASFRALIPSAVAQFDNALTLASTLIAIH